ncbi:MAG: hypothetical protein H7338_20155 [Candidatus Sericytochromatia bacterium]|nr:hypothetical protein [Candidatus Sericytochromatia bacterium]
MQRQRGSVLVVVTLFSMVLMGVSALAVDVGRTVVTRTRLQRVVDAAALAGGKDLPSGTAPARSASLDFANRNGVAIAAGDVTFPTPNSVRVAVVRPVDTVFARVMGIMSYPIPASATAALQSATGMSGLRPWGIPAQDFAGYPEGTTFKLKLTSKSGEYSGGGNFQALSLDGSGGSIYRQTIISGSQSRFQIGDSVPTETGNMVGPTSQGAETLIGGDTHTSYAAAVAAGEPDCPRVVTLIVIKQDSFGKGKSSVTVAGFASFFITSWNDPAEVVGQFVRYVDMDGTSDGTTSAVGTQAIALID